MTWRATFPAVCDSQGSTIIGFVVATEKPTDEEGFSAVTIWDADGSLLADIPARDLEWTEVQDD